MVARHLADGHLTLAAYAPVFDRAVVLDAKALIFVMALVFAPLLPLAFYRPHRPFGVHIVFALHLYVFVLTLFSLSLLIAEGVYLAGGGGLESPRVDAALSVFNLVACVIYLYLAIGPVYGEQGLMRAIKAAMLSIAVAAIGHRLSVRDIPVHPVHHLKRP